MIDASTYYMMHPSKVEKEPLEIENPDDNPSDDFLMRLPSTVFGFHMQEKKWRKCHPDSPIRRNLKASVPSADND